MRHKEKARHGMSENAYALLQYKYYALLKTSISVEFDSLDDFLHWSAGKYQYGMKLERIDHNGPYSPDNCRYVDAPKKSDARKNMGEEAERWEKFAAPIREKYAKQIYDITHRQKQFWQYEHPDLVRKGIVFEGSCSV